MLFYIGKRLAFIIPTLLGILIVNFFIIQTAPGGPVDQMVAKLQGLEQGKNKAPGVDSRTRYIYIHGTAEEGLIGRPASDGCIRMYNSEVIELFGLVEEKVQVWIY